MNKFTHASLFSGIDGFAYAAEQMNWQNIFHCEINNYLLELLKQRYPNAKTHTDITKTDFTIYRGTIDILTGGFPCQPYSSAGKRKGTEDERHLWPQMLRAIREIQPVWVVGENVRGIINWSNGLVFHEVQTDLENEGYEVQPFLLPASGVNAPHERYRTWFVAYSNKYRNNRITTTGNIKEKTTSKRSDILEQIVRPGVFGITSDTDLLRFDNRSSDNEINTDKTKLKTQCRFEQSACNEFIANPDGIGLRSKTNGIRKPKYTNKISEGNYWENFPTQSPVCNGNDGFSTELLRSFIIDNSAGLLTEEEVDKIISKTINATRKEIIKAGGNAVVSQVVLQIFKAIYSYELSLNEE